jgi:hypothetical protein
MMAMQLGAQGVRLAAVVAAVAALLRGEVVHQELFASLLVQANFLLMQQKTPINKLLPLLALALGLCHLELHLYLLFVLVVAVVAEETILPQILAPVVVCVTTTI